MISWIHDLLMLLSYPLVWMMYVMRNGLRPVGVMNGSVRRRRVHWVMNTPHGDDGTLDGDVGMVVVVHGPYVRFDTHLYPHIDGWSHVYGVFSHSWNVLGWM